MDANDPHLDQVAAQMGVPSVQPAPGAWVMYCDDCDEASGYDTQDDALVARDAHYLDEHDEDEADAGFCAVMTAYDFEHNGVVRWLAGLLPQVD